MKKKFAAALAAFFIIILILPGLSNAAVTPYFTAADNTLLPFNKLTMPFYSSGVWYVPSSVFLEFKIYSQSSTEQGMVHLYKGTKYVDFYEYENKSVDQDGREREGVSVRRHNGIYYLPLSVVCSYFDLQYSFISYEPISVLWIKSTQSVNSGLIISEKNFIGLNRDKMQQYANAYFAGETPQSPDSVQPPGPPETPPPTFEDVTVYLGFYNISAGYALDILNQLAVPGYRSCFFVSAGDIKENPELVRRIAGGGHSVGIRLLTGEYDEYLEASRLLFEAAKMKTVLISSDTAGDAARNLASENGLIYWEATREYNAESRVSSETVSSRLPTSAGSRYGIGLECSENISQLLPGVLSYLRRNFYSVVKLTETAAPAN